MGEVLKRSRTYFIAGFSEKAYWFEAKIDGGYPEHLLCGACKCITPQVYHLGCGHAFCCVCLKSMKLKIDKKMVYKCGCCEATSADISMAVPIDKSKLLAKKGMCAVQDCYFTSTLRAVKNHSLMCEKQADRQCIRCQKCCLRHELGRHMTLECSAPFITELCAAESTPTASLNRAQSVPHSSHSAVHAQRPSVPGTSSTLGRSNKFNQK